ncbi:TIGR03862 family flavoprotein [Parvularcula maris]|uniref:TIGR03862 family flavoprotein n=1 Tax=Parvularcula maris TaxID=2965077 RepID=A0A9X2RLH7_9PROT|nr:TIGR03862 family flavoprotein [Parvularcula maris]MCQ8186542.1 TIGR03862 family flavoprotein [Parvularcula maris]
MRIAVVGGGPAGLMAADVASEAGAEVTVYDRMPSLARKFLMAGKSGLNITHTEEAPVFLGRYGDRRISDIVKAYGGSEAVRDFMYRLKVEEHVGSSGRVFPKAMKASPLLRAWLGRLDSQGVKVALKHRLTGWDGLDLTFDTPNGEVRGRFDRIVFALGGGSWARLGSDGLWTDVFSSVGTQTLPFRPSNAGLLVEWSAHLLGRFEGEPVKNVVLNGPDGTEARGEFVITKRGIESGAVYPLVASIDRELQDGGAALTIDLLTSRTANEIAERLAKQPKKLSLANRLRRGLKITGVKASLLREGGADLSTDEKVAAALKALPLPITGIVPLDEAISTRGGVPWEALNHRLMLKAVPGVYCAGEMIDWDAPTGGYLLTACLATGWMAGGSAVVTALA